MLYAVISPEKQETFGFVDGLIPSLICILIVFAVLALLATILWLINKIKWLDVKEKPKQEVKSSTSTTREHIDFEALDDDAKAAVLAATIDYREEVKTDVELISVKEI
jgi:Na+-transporting methylmalonyl-CoA/oxaloacetate decarboxylase gamma subunit